MPFRIVLIEPEIPANTGNIGRTCVGLHAELHLVGRLGFSITDRRLKRAGLDYWPHLNFTHHPTWEHWWSKVEDPARVYFFSTKATEAVYDRSFSQVIGLFLAKKRSVWALKSCKSTSNRP